MYQDSFSLDVSESRSLTPQQSALLSSFDQLNEEGQQKAVDYVDDLVLTGRYKKLCCAWPGHKRSINKKIPFRYLPKRFVCTGVIFMFSTGISYNEAESAIQKLDPFHACRL